MVNDINTFNEVQNQHPTFLKDRYLISLSKLRASFPDEDHVIFESLSDSYIPCSSNSLPVKLSGLITRQFCLAYLLVYISKSLRLYKNLERNNSMAAGQ